jgi:hypothetical protein
MEDRTPESIIEQLETEYGELCVEELRLAKVLKKIAECGRIFACNHGAADYYRGLAIGALEARWRP